MLITAIALFHVSRRFQAVHTTPSSTPGDSSHSQLRHSPEGCPPRLKGAAAGWAVLPKLAVVVAAAAAGAAPKVNPVGAACGAAVLVVPMLKPVVPA